MLSPVCYIVISILYILCTTLRVIEKVETELLKVNEGVDPELLKVDVGVEWPSWQGRVSRVWVLGREWWVESHLLRVSEWFGLNSWKWMNTEGHLVERDRTTDVARQHDTGRSQGDEKKK